MRGTNGQKGGGSGGGGGVGEAIWKEKGSKGERERDKGM